MIDIQENVPLAPLTTLRVGGPARYFTVAKSEAEIVEALEYADDRGLPVLILGGGSNMVVSDDGFSGVVIAIALRGTAYIEDGDQAVLATAAAGEDWDLFVSECVGRGLAGIECLSGIPGRVGGTPIQNVGAYGQDVSETIVSVRCLARHERKIVDFTNSECGFSYRSSLFNSTHRDRYVVLSVEFRLVSQGAPKIEYRDLKEHFNGRLPSLAETRDAVLAIRKAKSMVIDPADPNCLSAGSFFKNPVVTFEVFDPIAAAYPAIPHFVVGDGMVKIPAAWLVEQAGFHKGYRLGGAGISSNHSLAIINLGGGSAAEIVTLKERIQQAVSSKFHIDLVPEPIFVGFA